MAHSKHPFRTINDPYLAQAERIIQTEFGFSVSVEEKVKNIFKFGRNPAVGTAATAYTLWATGQDQAHEIYPAEAVNSIDSISSDEAADGQVMVVEGHTEAIDNHGVARKTFVEQEVTLNGVTRVALPTALNRVSRLYNNGSVDLAGEVFVYENTALTAGKPTDTTKIHLTILRDNQSEKAATTLSDTDFWIITEVHTGVLNKTAAFADISLQIRRRGKVFRTVGTFPAANGGGDFHLVPYLIVPNNADVRLIAVASGATTDVAGSMNGYVATTL